MIRLSFKNIINVMSAASGLPSVNSRQLRQETEKVSDFNYCPAPFTKRILLEYPFLRKD